MLSPNKQLVVEVLTVIILGSATFVAMSSERSIETASRSGVIGATALNSAESPQESVRDYSPGN